MQIELKDIISRINISHVIGATDITVNAVVSIGDPSVTRTSLFWCSDKNQAQLLQVKEGVVIVSRAAYDYVAAHSPAAKSDSVSWLVVEKPRYVFMQVLKLIQDGAVQWGCIAESAHIHESVVLNRPTVSIGENVIIEAGSKIGVNVQIDHNTVIKSDTVIDDNVKIGANCTIGGVGFGYELTDEGGYELIPHIGNVVLRSNSEIGNNTCIDRAVLGSTVIGENVKIDNLVHIAHGVEIGKNSLIIANAMIAGSVKIGENCWVAPSVSIIQKTHIGDDAVVGLGSVVIRHVDARTVVAGVPAKKLKDK
ncbi:MAG: UDP-3-O-(3-hydroxymyristoyl)glucosamine N-acyltransferase [Bacteroidetes bacterium]|nr:UDP-3-O-(3-hydroxymyristoyl)glucosamine N-acyltransferase [Bacteroidota bacterium]